MNVICVDTGSNDKTLRVWDTKNGRQLTMFDMKVSVIDLVMTPDAAHVLVHLEDEVHVPLMCLHNSPAADATVMHCVEGMLFQ